MHGGRAGDMGLEEVEIMTPQLKADDKINKSIRERKKDGGSCKYIRNGINKKINEFNGEEIRKNDVKSEEEYTKNAENCGIYNKNVDVGDCLLMAKRACDQNSMLQHNEANNTFPNKPSNNYGISKINKATRDSMFRANFDDWYTCNKNSSQLINQNMTSTNRYNLFPVNYQTEEDNNDVNSYEHVYQNSHHNMHYCHPIVI